MKKFDVNDEAWGGIHSSLDIGDSTVAFFEGFECDIVYDNYLIFDENWDSETLSLQPGTIPAGIYSLLIKHNGQLIGAAKVVVK